MTTNDHYAGALEAMYAGDYETALEEAEIDYRTRIEDTHKALDNTDFDDPEWGYWKGYVDAQRSGHMMITSLMLAYKVAGAERGPGDDE